ncbi:MAG: hypothetical protein QF682_06215 [Candidatus Thermoplasmatota archaeon]|nr:hypothetical protein [Candidatus Thermoplasmatota archaeon]
MKMIIKCGNDECRKEFSANTVDPYWECPDCSRKIENRFFPFLNARMMEAKANPDKANWAKLFKEHLGVINGFVTEKREQIGLLMTDFDIPEVYELEEFNELVEEKKFDAESFDRLLKRGHTVAIYLIDVLNKARDERN